MSLEIPNLEELFEQSLIDLKNKEENLIKIKESQVNSSNDLIMSLQMLKIKFKEGEIEELKELLDKHKELVREIKLKQILI
jgi:hypothetical protein